MRGRGSELCAVQGFSRSSRGREKFRRARGGSGAVESGSQDVTEAKLTVVGLRETTKILPPSPSVNMHIYIHTCYYILVQILI